MDYLYIGDKHNTLHRLDMNKVANIRCSKSSKDPKWVVKFIADRKLIIRFSTFDIACNKYLFLCKALDISRTEP